MATKYTSEFKSTHGAHYRVTIDDNTYGGSSPVEITMAPPGFTIEYDGSTSDRYQWVIGSTARIYYLATTGNHTALLSDIAGSAEGRYKVKIEQYNSGWETRWVGVILPEQIETEDIDYPQPFSLTASDDLANLKEVDYNAGAGTPYTGSATVAEHFANCISKLRTSAMLETTVVRIEEAWQSNQSNTNGYDRMGVRHPAFYAPTESPYQLEYFSAHEVLEQLCSAFGLRIFHQNGQFIAQSISQASDAPTTINYSDTNASGVVTNTSLSRPNTNTDANGINRLRGWRNSYLNPLRRVERDHQVGEGLFFAGTQYYEGTSTGSGAGTGLLDGTVSVAPINATDYLNPGDPLSLTFKVALSHFAVAFTGDNRVLPFRISAQVRIGNQYMNRPVTFSGTYETPLISGGFVDVAAYTYGEATWSTDSASRVEFVTPPQQMTVDQTTITTFGISLEGLPAGFTGDTVSFSFEADAIGANGSVYANAVNAFNYATNYIQQVGVVRIYIAQTYLMEGGVATYRAENAESNGGRETFHTGETKIGDNIGPETQNYTYALDASDNEVTTENWKRIGQTESLELAGLLCREVLAGQTKTIRIQRGTLIDTNDAPGTWAFTMEHTLTHDTNKYLPFTLTIDAHADTFAGEFFELVTDRSDITVPGIEWTGEVTDPADDTVALESLMALSGTQGDTIADQQTKLQYITVTQSVNLDTVESTVQTHEGEINSLQYFQQNTEAILKGAFSGGGAGIYEDSSKSTASSYMGITSTTAHLQAGTNTYLNITESSPGNVDFYVQAGTPGNERPIKAIAIDGSSTAQTATVSFAVPTYGIAYSDLSGTPSIPTGELVNDTTPQLGGDLDGNGYNIDLSGNTASQLIITGNQYAFRYRSTNGVLQNTGLFFNQTTGQYEFLNGSAACIFCIKAGTGELTIGTGTAAYTLPIDRGTAGQVLQSDGAGNVDFQSLDTGDVSEGSNLYYTNARVDARIALANIDDLADVNASSPTNGQVLTWDTSTSRWIPDNPSGGGGGSDSFNTIAVSGQSDVVADSGNDTLTLAAGTNLAITTNATTDTITFTPSLTPILTSILTTGPISALGAISTGASLSVGTTAAFTGAVTMQSTLTVGSTLIAQGIDFTGGGNATIGIATGLPNQPDDLELLSNGNVTVVLDYDSDEAAQAFIVKNQAGTVIFKVDEDGVSSGLFTTTQATLSTIADFETSQTGTITVTNYDSSLTYSVAVLNSDGTSNGATITDNQDGTWSVTNSQPATGAYAEVRALELGKLASELTTSNTFDINAPQTQKRYWRLQMTDANKNPVSSKVALGNFRLYTQTGGGGTAYPSNMTSNTAPSPYVATGGYRYSTTYDYWRAFDSNIGAANSMWWTLGNSVAANNWIQIDLGSSIEMGSGECQIRTTGGWTDANYAVLYGSNTGAFAGEEREMAFFQNIDKAGEPGGTFTTYTVAIT